MGEPDDELGSEPDSIDIDAAALVDDEPMPLRSFGAAELPAAVDEVELAAFPGELVLFHPRASTVHLLGAVAGATWLCCDGATTVADLGPVVAEAVDAPFGPEVDAEVAVALGELDRAGLLAGSSPGVLALQPTVPPAPDGTEVLAPPFTLHDDPLDELAWAGTATVRLGRGTLLVRVRVEDPVTLRRVRTLLEPWLEPEEVEGVSPMFGVLAPGEGRGPRRLAELRAGAMLVERDPDVGAVLAALGAVLASIDAQHRAPERVWLGMRACVADQQVVLVDALPPALTSARALAAAGLWVPPTWVVEVAEPGMVHVPTANPALGWEAAGLHPAAAPSELALAGCVVAAEAHLGPLDTPGQVLAHLAALSPHAAWFRVAAVLVEQGRVHVVRGDRRDPVLQRAARSLLGRP